MSKDPYIRAMFGMSAVQVPLHGIIQDQGEGVSLIVMACRFPGEPMRFGSKTTHQFFFGDAVFRPRGVWESNKFRGYGLNGLVTSSAFCEPDEWDRLVIRDGVPVTKEVQS